MKNVMKVLGRQVFVTTLSIVVIGAGVHPSAFAQQNDDLFPTFTPQPRPMRPVIIQPTDPMSPTKPTDPWLPIPVPGGSWDPDCLQNPSLPKCRSSGSVYVPPAPGTPGPRDQNGRPVIYVSTNVPPEYDCPLFENRPYEALNQAIDALSYAMTTVPECSQHKETMQNISTNNEAIKTSIAALQAFMKKPEASAAGIGQMEQQITAAISAATNLGQIFSSSALLQTRCGREVMTAGKALLALNDILNNLAPYALAAVAINPALGTAAKFAITGGAIATSSISSIVKMIEQGTVDMTNPEHRKAVLKNTCQFTKISRKVRFMQLAQSGQIQTLTTELETNLSLYKANYQVSSKDLQAVIAFQQQSDQMAEGIENQVRKDRFELSFVAHQMKEAKDDDQYLCLIASELVRRSSARDTRGGTGFESYIFPATVATTLSQAAEYSGKNDDLKVATLLNMNSMARKRLRALEDRVMADDAAAIKMCGQTARTWVNGLAQMLKLTGELVNTERLAIEQELGKDPQYSTWRDQYRKIQDEQQTVNRVARVMRELSKDNSVIDRSELDQRIYLLKGALFGVRGSWALGNSPVMEWLEHTMRLHGNRISSFSDNISRLQSGSYEIIKTGRTQALNQRTSIHRQTEELVRQNKAAMSLEPINLTNVKIGTRGHEEACKTLESAWLDWAAAIDHLNASRFMCDMISPYLDNKVEKNLISFCLGNIGYDGRQITKSRLQMSATNLLESYQSNKQTYATWSVNIGKKMQELKCSLPPVSVMN